MLRPDMPRWLKRLGLALSLGAYAVLAFHVHHADGDHSDPTHHCCPCHSYSAAPNVSVAIEAPASAYAEFRAAPSLAPFAPPPGRDGSPRAPPLS